MHKFHGLINRLTNKVRMSATPVTGFLVGLSGTDSIVTTMLLCEVARTEKFKVEAVHFSDDLNDSKRIRATMEWLRERHEKLILSSSIPMGGNHDQCRWATLHFQAAHERAWVASTVNATEKALGTYSIMANSASIAPIQSLYKSDVLAICEWAGVPQEIIAASRIPDCICGRDEFAAENIELIDEVLRNNLSQDYPAHLIRNAMDYIRETKLINEFKNRTPYSV